MKFLLLLLLAVFPLQAQQGGAPASFIRKANQWMSDSDPAKRKAAYLSWLQLGPEAMPDYEKSLNSSFSFHDHAIDKLCQDAGSPKNPYLKHEPLADELDTERERVMPLIRTDWKKDPKEIAKLREEMDTLGRLHEKTLRTAKTDTAPFDAAIDSHFAALVEVTRELERFDSEADSSSVEDNELHDRLIAEHIEGAHLLKLKERFLTTRQAAEALEKTSEANKKAGPWANAAMVDFAEILNTERDILGLPPLALEEKLSAAAEGHSKDMARLGFFAHESPVPNKKSPWDRARLAGFTGKASGENIYMGSGNPQAAYNGWFGSDGHRFIMMANGPNVLGVGIAGRHWTMMTGRR